MGAVMQNKCTKRQKKIQHSFFISVIQHLEIKWNPVEGFIELSRRSFGLGLVFYTDTGIRENDSIINAGHFYESFSLPS